MTDLHDEATERRLLGGIIADPEIFPQVKEILRSHADFGIGKNGKVYDAMTKLFAEGTTIDLMTVSDQLKKDGQQVSDIYLTELTERAYSGHDAPTHARIVVEYALRRDQIDIANRLKVRAEDMTEDVFAIQKESIGLLDGLYSKASKTTKHISAIVDSAREFLAKLVLSPEELGIIKFGFRDLDDQTGGCFPKNFIVVGGLRKSGKTTSVLQTIFHNAKAGNGVIIFSQEMSAEELCLRYAFVDAKVNMLKALKNELSDPDQVRLLEKFEELKKLPVYINDQTDSISDICYEAARMKRSNNIKLGIVDYIQLVSPDGGDDNREQEIAKISHRLKRLAKQENLVIFGLTQLNEGMKSRESRAIEQDADKIIYIDAKEDELLADGATGKVVELKLVQRFGPSGAFGSIKLWYDLTIGAFRDYSYQSDPAQSQKDSNNDLPF